MEHAIIQPSSAERWVKCNGSVLAEATYPEIEASQSSKEGTASHWVASEVLGSYKPLRNVTTCDSFIGKVAPNGILITEEMTQGAELYVMDVLQTANARGLLGVLRVEERVKIKRVHIDNWGTPDNRAFDATANTLYIWDYKFGHRFVEVFENWQLMDYAIGAVDELVGVSDLDITVIFRIVQPRSFHYSGPIREWRINASELRPFANIMKGAAEDATGENPAMTTGPHCRDCKARHACQGAQQVAYNAMDISGEVINTVDMSPENMGVELSMLHRAADALKFRITGMEAQVEAGFKSGVQFPGWMMEQSRGGNRKWNKPVDDVLMMGKIMDVDLSNPGLKSPTEAKKLGIDESVINEYSSKSSGGMKLVKDDGSLARRIFSQSRIK